MAIPMSIERNIAMPGVEQANFVKYLTDANLPINKGDRVNIGDCWININKGNNFNRPHVHPGAILSAVFYLDDWRIKNKIGASRLACYKTLLCLRHHPDKRKLRYKSNH